MFGTRSLRLTSAITLFFFAWTILSPTLAVALPKDTAPVQTEARNLLDELRDTALQARAKVKKGRSHESEAQRLMERENGLDTEQAQAEAEFAEVGKQLDAKGLPDEIKARHQEAVAAYRAGMQTLRQHLRAVREARGRQDKTGEQHALDGLAGFLEQGQKRRAHQPLDPKNLPFRAPDETPRPAREKKEEIEPLLHAAQPVQVAASDLVPGLLAQATPAVPGLVPTPDDLAATEDVQITQAIQDQATALHHNPVEIWNWVRNSIEFLPTYGSIQGSDLTLQTKRGNAFDTASLLIALLRASSIPARYVYGTVQVPAEQVMNWVGGVKTPEAAQSLLGQGGIPTTALVSGGKITAFKLEHVWVSAFVDYVPSRGAVNNVGDTWVPLDGGFKARQDRPGLDLITALPLNAQAIADTAKVAATCDADSAKSLDTTPVSDALADYGVRLNRYLDTLDPDLTVADLLGASAIATTQYPFLLGSLPYTVLRESTATPALADNLRWRMRYELYASDLDRAEQRPVATLTRSLPALAGRRITLGFAPATEADAATLTSYLPAPHADGSPIQASEFPASLPGYLIQMRAELRVDGELVASGGSFAFGQPLLGTVAHFDPATLAWHDSVHGLHAGEYHALVIDGQGVAAAQLDALGQTLGEARAVLDAGQADSLDRDGLTGAFLQQLLLAYFALADAHDAVIAEAAGMAQAPLPSYGRAALRLEPTLWFGLVQEARFLGTALRVDSLTRAVASKRDAVPVAAYRHQAQQRASAYAHQIPQHLLIDAQRPGEAVSAVKALATAAGQGLPLLTLTADNATTQLARIGLDTTTKGELGDAAAAGFDVLAQAAPVTLGGYTGGGYYLENPQTGLGDYRLSTASAGGATGVLYGPAGLGHLAPATPAQAAGSIAPALTAAVDLNRHLAALLQARADQTRWAHYPARNEVAAALFLARLGTVAARDACDQALDVVAADLAVTAGLPAPGTPANQAPRIDSAPVTTATAQRTYRYQSVASDPEGASLAYRLVEGPTGLTVDARGLVSWNSPVAGSYSVRLRIDDGHSFVDQTYTLTVAEASPYLDAALSITPAIANPGDPILVTVAVTGGSGGTPSVQLTVDGVLQPLNANGQTQLTAAASGTHRIAVTAATEGGTITRESQYTVRDPNDGDTPAATLTSPVQDAEITAPVDLIGSANDSHFAYYQVLVRPAGDPDTAWRELFRRYDPVTNGSLGRFDPSILANGLYDLALRVVDANGQASLATAPVEVRGDLKLGPFQVAFEDLALDAAGIPVRVVRSYDSLRRAKALDFGWGWSVDYQSTSVRKNMTLGLGWQVTNIFLQLKLCLRPLGQRKVAVTLPDGRVERFTAANAQECAFAQVPPLDVRFTAQPGTTSTLELVNDGALVMVQGGMLVDADTGAAWNPTRFKLTTDDGYAYYLKEGVGIEQIKDPYGNTLTYGRNGIIHSAGLSVAFQRDAQGRITRITDPQGKSLQYAYNSRGDLVSVTDRAGQVSRFDYLADHLLAELTDPRGIRASQQVYDAQGRLIALIDADGHRTDLAFEEDAHRQVVADRLGYKTTYTYDDQGNVTSITDPLGQVTTYAYDALGNETAVTDPLGQTTHKTYDTQSGKILSETDPLGSLTRYAYSDDKTQLKNVTDPLGRITNYTYFRGLPTGIQEPLGRATSLGYDGQGNLTSLGLTGQTTRYTYNSKGQKLSETDPAGRTIQYTLDANGHETGRTWTRTGSDGKPLTLAANRRLDAEGRVLAETGPDGATTQREYNGAGKVTKETDPLGRVTTYVYDAQARLVKTTYPDGSADTTTYDANGNVIAETDRAGRVTRSTYDALNRLVRTTQPDGTTTDTVYDTAGRVWKTLDALGRATENRYDAAGRLVASIAPDGQTTRYAYDAVGNRTQTTAPDGQTTTYAYDDLNRLIKTTAPDGTFSQTVWRADGLKQSETDPTGRVRDYGYDAAGRLNQVKESQGLETTVYAYDEDGNKLRQTDAEGRTTRWDYDAANRPLARTLPGGAKESYQYDKVGRLAAHTGFDGRLTLYAYDAADRLAQISHPEGRATQYTYDAQGRIQTATTALGTTRYQYDAQGRKVRETRPEGTVLAWTYDTDGNITERSGPGGTTRYAYDVQGRPTRITDPQGQATTYGYDANGRLLTRVTPNGIQTTHAYDANGRLVQLLHRQPDGGLLAGVGYGLAANGQRLELREYDSFSIVAGDQAQNPARTTRYQYDTSGRLTLEETTDRAGQVQRSVLYAYDKVGNRLQKTLTTPAGSETTQYAYDANDRLTSETTTVNGTATTTTYDWDANGRLVQKTQPGQVTRYGWDSDDHLIEVKRGPDAATAQTVATYAYDAQGQRVKKVEKTAQGDQVTDYLVDDTFAYAQVVEERTSLAGRTDTARYVWGDDGLIAQVQGNQASYVHADGLGSVKALTDAAGTLTDSYGYDAFGNGLERAGGSAQPYRFAGEYFDPEVGMQYHRARWYAPEVGRFVAMDPFSGNPRRPATLNKYAYANNDPVDEVDPSGKFGMASVSVSINIMSTFVTSTVRGMAADLLMEQMGMNFVSSFINTHTAPVGAWPGNPGGALLVSALANACLYNHKSCFLRKIPTLANGYMSMPVTTQHIWDSMTGDGDTKFGPGRALPFLLGRVPGKGAGSNSRSFLNRKEACTPSRPVGKACDEYPYSSTLQGGSANYDAGGVSVRLVPAYEQYPTQRNELNDFYRKAKVDTGGITPKSLFFNVVTPLRNFYIDREGKWHLL